MKKILVGIDFSKTSVVALKYAINIAQQTESDLLLLNVQKHMDYEVPLMADEKRGPREVIEQFEKLLKDFEAEIPRNVEFRVMDGVVHKEIANQARYSQAWLIIVGAHGLSGFQEYWMGSESYRVVATASTPVISVRQNYDVTRPLKKVILPIDSTFETVQKIPYTLDLAKKYNAQVHILSLYSSSVDSVRQKVDASTHDAMRQAEMSGLEMIVENVRAEHITEATIEYAKLVDADLISIMTEQEFAPRNIFLGSYAQQMVNRSPVPVLSMHAKMVIKDSESAKV